MQVKMATSAPSTPVQIADVTASIRTARLSCREAGKPPIFTPVGDSSGESRLIQRRARDNELTLICSTHP